MNKVSINFKFNGNIYSDDLDSWALLKIPDDKGVIGRILVSPVHCREEFIGDVLSNITYAKDKDPTKQALVGKNGWSYLMMAMGAYSDELFAIYDQCSDRREKGQKTRELEKKLAMTEHNKLHKRVKNAVEFLNYFESKAEWKKSSIIQGPLMNETRSDDQWYENAYWIFQINNKWFNSTYMLSMVILILRTGLYLTLESIKSYVNGKLWTKVEIKDNVKFVDFPSELEAHVKTTARYWTKILTNYNDLFPIDKDDPLAYWHGAAHEEGIYYLITNNIHNAEVAERMALLKPKNKFSQKDREELKRMAAKRAREREEDW